MFFVIGRIWTECQFGRGAPHPPKRSLCFSARLLRSVILNEVKDLNGGILRCAQNDNKGAEPRGLSCLPAIALAKAGAKPRGRVKNKNGGPSRPPFLLCHFFLPAGLSQKSVRKRCLSALPAAGRHRQTLHAFFHAESPGLCLGVFGSLRQAG